MAVASSGVTYGDGRNEIIPIEQLAALVTEQGNPGNLRNVVRALVEVPSRRFETRHRLVDTPGLGFARQERRGGDAGISSGLRSGAVADRCSTTLNEEDIGTLRLLYEAGIPALVLLSKSDLMAEGDLHRAVAYIEEQLHSELGNCDPSPRGKLRAAARVLLDHFFEREAAAAF